MSTSPAGETKKRYALVDDHGTPFGFYDEITAAQADLDDLGNPTDLGIIEVQQQPTEGDYRIAVRNWLEAVINHRWQ